MTLLALLGLAAGCGDDTSSEPGSDTTTADSTAANGTAAGDPAGDDPFTSEPSATGSTDAGSADAGGSAGTAGPATDVEPGSVEALVVLEAYWMCDVARFAFTDLDEMQAELDQRLADNGVDAEVYAEFQERLAGDPELRSAVLAGYRDYCDDSESAEG